MDEVEAYFKTINSFPVLGVLTYGLGVGVWRLGDSSHAVSDHKFQHMWINVSRITVVEKQISSGPLMRSFARHLPINAADNSWCINTSFSNSNAPSAEVIPLLELRKLLKCLSNKIILEFNFICFSRLYCCIVIIQQRNHVLNMIVSFYSWSGNSVSHLIWWKKTKLC